MSDTTKQVRVEPHAADGKHTAVVDRVKKYFEEKAMGDLKKYVNGSMPLKRLTLYIELDAPDEKGENPAITVDLTPLPGLPLILKSISQTRPAQAKPESGEGVFEHTGELSLALHVERKKEDHG